MKARSILCVLLLALAGCDLLLNKPEGNVGREADDLVWNAVAPEYTVAVAAASLEEGRTNYDDYVTVKQNIAVQIRFTPATEFKFIRWMAYAGIPADVNAVPLTDDQVAFADPFATETNATVKVSSIGDNRITLRPLTVGRPRVLQTNLPEGLYPRTVTNYPVQIRFATPVKAETATLWVESGALANGASPNGHIRITGVYEYGNGVTDVNFARFFQTPALSEDRTMLNLRVDKAVCTAAGYGAGLPINCNITVTLDTGFVGQGPGGTGVPDELNQAEPLSPIELSYGILDKPDETPPQVSEVRGFLSPADKVPFARSVSDEAGAFISAVGSDEVMAEGARRALRYEDGKPVVYLLFNAYDELEDVAELFVAEDRRFNVQGGEIPAAEVLPMKDHTQDMRGADIPDNSRKQLITAYHSPESGVPNDIEPYVIRHELETTLDGIIDLVILPKDSVENVADAADRSDAAGARRVRVLLDTAPGPVTNIVPTYDPLSQVINLAWSNPAAPDVQQINVSFQKEGGSRYSSAPLSAGITGVNLDSMAPGNYTFFISVVDCTGHWSPEAAIAYTAYPQQQAGSNSHRIYIGGFQNGQVRAFDNANQSNDFAGSIVYGRTGGWIRLVMFPDDGCEAAAPTVMRGDGGGAVVVTPGDPNVYRFQMPNTSVEVSASFQRKVYTITNPGGWSNGTVSVQGTARVNDTVTINLSPSAGYEFASAMVTKADDDNTVVTLSGGGNVRSFTMPAYDVKIAGAVFAQLHAVTTKTSTEVLDDNGNTVIANYGTIVASPSRAAAGTTVTLTVSPTRGWKLDDDPATGSGLDRSGLAFSTSSVTALGGSGNFRSFVMPDSDVTVTAQFVRDPAYFNQLSTLSVSKGELTPAFRPGVKNYRVVIPNNETGLQISASSIEDVNVFVDSGGIVSGLNVGNGNSREIEIRVVPKIATEADRYKVRVFRRPTAPVISNVTAGDRQVDISWKPVTGANGYELYIYEVREGDVNVIMPSDPDASFGSGTTSTTITRKGDGTLLKNGSLYYIWLRAKAVHGEDGNYAVFSEYTSVQGKPSSNVAALKAIRIKRGDVQDGSLTVTENKTAYSYGMAFGNLPAANVSVEGIPADDATGAKIEYRIEQGVYGEFVPFTLAAGQSKTIQIRVTAQSGRSVKEYSLQLSGRRRFQIEITGPYQEDINFYIPDDTPKNSNDEIKLSRKDGTTVGVSASSDRGVTGVEWYVDGTLKGTGTGITLRAADYAVKKHTLSVMVYTAGVPYSNTINFEVVQ